jgi:TonB family protein
MIKFLLFLLLCLFLPVLVAGQTADDYFAALTSSTSSSPSPAAESAYSTHNRLATDQLYTHVAAHLSYPAQDALRGLEGTVIATFTVAPDGTIRRVRISESELPRPFGKELVAIIKAKKKINFTGPSFRGSARFHLPVKFSL